MKISSRKFTWLTLFALTSLCAASARASEVYSFSFTPTSGSVESFTFSLIAPTFVTNGQSPAFTPFVVTDGTHSATMSLDDFVYSAPNSCFEFVTATLSSLGTCSTTAISPAGGTAFFSMTAPLPTTDGTYGLSGIVVFYYGAALSATGFGNVNLTVSATPEPASALLVLLGIAGAMLGRATGAARKRIAFSKK